MPVGKYAALSLAGAALLVGCNRGVSSNQSAGANASAAIANNAAPAAPPAPPPTGNSSGSALDEAFIVGHWSDDPGCVRTISFNADGTTVTSGDETGRWRVEGDALVTEGPGNPPQRIPIARNGDALVLTGATGTNASLTRCSAPAPATPGADRPAPGAYQDEKSN
jgi:hypothetical protein